MDILTAQQEVEARRQLSHEDHCLRCNCPLPNAEARYLGMFPTRTKKHRYVNCIVLCRTCEEDQIGTRRWFNNLEEYEALNMAKDRRCFAVQVR